MPNATSDASGSDPSGSDNARSTDVCPRHARSKYARSSLVAAPEPPYVPSAAAAKQAHAKPTYAATIKPTPWSAAGSTYASTATRLSSTSAFGARP